MINLTYLKDVNAYWLVLIVLLLMTGFFISSFRDHKSLGVTLIGLCSCVTLLAVIFYVGISGAKI